MSGAFYHYKQRCEELEKELEQMRYQRDHYFAEAERLYLLFKSAEKDAKFLATTDAKQVAPVSPGI